jgi:hypothetical protein
MPFEEVKYNFPHEAKDDPSEIEIELEPSSAETINMPSHSTQAEDEFEIEVVDDTPVEDRGRKPSKTPPEDVTDEELENYSEKVANRIKHFSKGYHDERRAKEAALRERVALEDYTKKLIEENKTLKTSVGKSRSAIIEQVKRMLTTEIETAKREYAAAYESGDTDKVMAAEEKLSSARLKHARVENIKTPLQKEDNSVKENLQSSSNPQPAELPVRDEKAEDWASDNPWFGSDDEMTSFALGLHQKLVKSGFDPKSEEYYGKINSRMREVFSDYFGESSETKKSQTNVAPATRSRAPKKVKLEKSQIAIAKRLGVPIDLYAKQVANEIRKAKNG